MSKFFLFHGEDSYLSLKQAKERVNEIKEGLQDSSILTIDADTTESTTIISKMTSTDMFSTQKIVFLKRTSKNKDKERLTETLTTLLETTNGSPVIFWEDHKVNGVTKFFKFFKKHNVVEEFAPMKQQSFIRWAKEQLDRYGIESSPNDLLLLSQRSNFQSERFINELDKLSLAGVKALTQQAITENSSDTLEHTIWKLIDSINAGDKKESLRIAESLIENGEDVHFILAMLVRNTRLLACTKDLSEKGNNAKQIASKLRVAPFTVFPLLKATKNLSMEKIKAIYEKLAGLDYSMKTGEIDEKLGLTLLLTRL